MVGYVIKGGAPTKFPISHLVLICLKTYVHLAASKNELAKQIRKHLEQHAEVHYQRAYG